jgi:hypothetical protein
MRPARQIIQELRTRDLYELASRVAAEHRLKLDELCSDAKRATVVAGRHALWEQLRLVLSSNADIARIWGTDHTSVDFALREPPTIVEVVLAVWPVDLPDDFPEELRVTTWSYREFVLRWRRNPKPFGVTDCDAGETEWFADYCAARAAFDQHCRDAGAPSFVGRARARDPDTPPTEATALVGGGAP